MTTAAVVATSAPDHELLPVASRPSPGAARARTEELYEAYARTIGGLCRALLRNVAEAEDALQEVFLSAHRALLNGSDPREPAAWLATIARNECWARIRVRMREPLPSDDAEIASTLPDPLAEAIRRADLAALWRAIEQLPRQQRDALLMREFGGLSYDELAVALAVSTPAVESLLFRARHELRTRLRTAYASLSGVSWVDALLRLLSGSGAAAPIAAKAVALGVGAAAVTGGAAIGPHAPIQQPHHVQTARVTRHTAAVRVEPWPSVAVLTVRRTDDGNDSGDRAQQISPRAPTAGDGESGSSSDGGGDGVSGGGLGGGDAVSGGDGSRPSGGAE